ncbi:hypothetical protein DY000_02052134 [Brassica cretica]|uniref:Uncharacterized protein n=1 Tax=Brassica cretica TaxID=69181 RepID=A0ABQ7A9C1_BRACR|nr:hypothetical protein DY000_02052134 [Brassica cretica]
MCGSSGRVEWRGFGSGVRSGLWLRDLSLFLALSACSSRLGEWISLAEGVMDPLDGGAAGPPRAAFVSKSEWSTAGSPSWGRVRIAELLVLSTVANPFGGGSFDGVWRFVGAPSPIKLDLLNAGVLGHESSDRSRNIRFESVLDFIFCTLHLVTYVCL